MSRMKPGPRKRKRRALESERARATWRSAANRLIGRLLREASVNAHT